MIEELVDADDGTFFVIKHNVIGEFLYLATTNRRIVLGHVSSIV